MRSGSTITRGICMALAALSALMVLTVQAALALDVPPLRGRINDYAGMLSQDTVHRLDMLLKDLEQTESTQIVVLTVPSLEGEILEEFSMRVAEQWRIGQEGRDNGAVLLIARAERKVRIEVGYGLEGRLTDLQAGRIIRRVIVPEFQAGRFDEGVANGVQAMIDTVRGEFTAEAGKTDRGIGVDDILPFLFMFVVIVLLLGGVSRRLGTTAGGILAPFLGHTAFSPGPVVLIVLAGIGLIAGFLLSVFAGIAGRSGPRKPGGRPRTRYRGFPLGGGISIGGGKFGGGGGFSGGGGGFGGGGASGGW
ncbi:TPM domain-containing protein [Desulfococcus multivorans]|uniref:TPM domain-containing protein n=1 Tax=Desulfococcus multivorans DSM 2059 TaxID=1121405 RepID=S7TU74_DESML|nr:TPM domain-containing protein [Desulfococcus multivorans]EPR40275.1 protein of unknown function DUF477 [Desulfococcus multivorans DSM 2059]SJZ61756.1 uncharacterized protein SAMN02745446_01144 [Desulfococcus multivorans DSM 2059]